MAKQGYSPRASFHCHQQVVVCEPLNTLLALLLG